MVKFSRSSGTRNINIEINVWDGFIKYGAHNFLPSFNSCAKFEDFMWKTCLEISDYSERVAEKEIWLVTPSLSTIRVWYTLTPNFIYKKKSNPNARNIKKNSFFFNKRMSFNYAIRLWHKDLQEKSIFFRQSSTSMISQMFMGGGD